MPFNTDAKSALLGLAEGLLPLQLWIETPGKYIPPDPNLPWRQGKEKLSHDRLRTIEYVEWLVAASDADDLLLERWDLIKRKPLVYCPLPAARAYREGRGLSQSPRFATVEGGNTLADASGRQMSRRQLYTQCCPILINTVRDAEERLGPRDQSQSTFWTTLANEMHCGNCPEWRAAAGAPQSTLLTEQFLRDLLTALLNGWLDIPPPWRYAILIELGEFRRPGNAYVRLDVDNARTNLENALSKQHPAKSPKAVDSLGEDVRFLTSWKSVP